MPNETLAILTRAVDACRSGLVRRQVCDKRWRSDGEWHSCELDRRHGTRRHFCSCEASTKRVPSVRLALPPLPELSHGGKKKTAEQSFDEYLRKAGGIPEAGSGSDRAVFAAASWAKFNLPDLSEHSFIQAIRCLQPSFDERWIEAKWKSAHR